MGKYQNYFVLLTKRYKVVRFPLEAEINAIPNVLVRSPIYIQKIKFQ